jgi:predicted aminopeptidase
MDRNLRNRFWLIFLALASLVTLGCEGQGLQYLVNLGIGEVDILTHSVPLDEALNDPNLSAEYHEKLLWVKQARGYAQDTLGLNVGDSYLYFYNTGDKPAVYNLSAAWRDALEANTWNFPLAGEFQYLGFFDQQAAVDYGLQLQDQGYDVVIYGAIAYSTGGFFHDPIYSSLLQLDKPLLADTVIHELTHNTVYRASESEFNESVANFCGKVGAREFIKSVAGADSDLYRQDVEQAEDRDLVNQFLAEIYDELAAFYARTDLSSEEKIKQREPIFEAARLRFQTQVLGLFHDPERFKAWGNVPTNNAWILLNRRYNKGMDLFQKVYEQFGSDLRQTIPVLQQAAQQEDPWQFLQDLVNSTS